MSDVSQEVAAVTPDEIPMDLNEVDTARPNDSYRETGKTLIFKGVITKAYAGVARNNKEPDKSTNNLQLDLTIRALGPTGNIAGPEGRFWVTVPVGNPMIPGHKPYASGQEYDRVHQEGREFIRAVLGSDALPPFPVQKEGEKGAYVNPATGEEVDLQQRKAMIEDIHKQTRVILSGWYNELRKTGTCELLKATLYFGTKKRKGKSFSSIQYVRPDDGGREVVADTFTE